MPWRVSSSRVPRRSPMPVPDHTDQSRIRQRQAGCRAAWRASRSASHSLARAYSASPRRPVRAMIEPKPTISRRRSGWREARAARRCLAPATLGARVRRSPSSSMAPSVRGRLTPAACSSAVIGPSSVAARSTAARTAVSSATSARRYRVRMPVAAMRSRLAASSGSVRGSERPRIASRAPPDRAIASAHSAPIPLPPPVTSSTSSGPRLSKALPAAGAGARCGADFDAAAASAAGAAARAGAHVEAAAASAAGAVVAAGEGSGAGRSRSTGTRRLPPAS